jgi:hypothetical protein
VLRSSAALATALVALAATSCGSTSTKSVSGQTASTTTAAATTSTPTRAQFIAQADSVCRAAGQATERFRRQLIQAERESSTPRRRSFPPILRQLIASERASVTKLRSLPEPAPDTTTITKWLTAASEAINDQSNLTDAFVNNERTAREAASQAANNAKALARSLAKGYGFKVCAVQG